MDDNEHYLWQLDMVVQDWLCAKGDNLAQFATVGEYVGRTEAMLKSNIPLAVQGLHGLLTSYTPDQESFVRAVCEQLLPAIAQQALPIFLQDADNRYALATIALAAVTHPWFIHRGERTAILRHIASTWCSKSVDISDVTDQQSMALAAIFFGPAWPSLYPEVLTDVTEIVDTVYHQRPPLVNDVGANDNAAILPDNVAS